MQPHEHIIVAYDRSTANDDDIALMQKLSGEVGVVKLGLETLSAIAPGNSVPIYYRLLPILHHAKIGIMGDWKLKDIKNTVEKSVRNIAAHGVWGCTVHADVSEQALRAAVAARAGMNIIGVTVLTDISPEECKGTFGRIPTSQVSFFAEKLVACGAQAVVCSPLEIEIVRKTVGTKLICITPGIRSRSAPPDDQKRTMTAGDAIRAGADYLVIGRPIMEAADTVAAARTFAEEIATAKANRSMI